MSLYDKASLIMTPSGAKATKLYSHKPHNGNGDFTFDRSTTATRVNKDGLIETVAADVPRLDYPLIDGVVQDCPALLLEPSRTNLMANSENISTWSSSGTLTKTLSIDVSPDGSQTADRIQEPTGVGFHYIYQQGSCSANSTHTGSIFVKKVSSETNFMGVVLFYTGVTSKIAYGIINTVEGTIVSSSSTITPTFKVDDYGDYWRFSITATDTGSNTLCRFGVYATLSTDGITLGAGISSIRTIWGAQLEQGSYPTSYIPTSGSAVTRNADVCNSAGTSAEFNDSEGVLYLECAAIANDSTYKLTSISDGSSSNRVSLGYHNTDNRLYAQLNDGDSIQVATYYDLNDATENNKFAFKYKSNDCSIFLNGFEVFTDTVATMPSGLSEFNFNHTDNLPLYGNLKETAIFKEALTDSELEELTSWDSFNEMATEQLYTIE